MVQFLPIFISLWFIFLRFIFGSFLFPFPFWLFTYFSLLDFFIFLFIFLVVFFSIHLFRFDGLTCTNFCLIFLNWVFFFFVRREIWLLMLRRPSVFFFFSSLLKHSLTPPQLPLFSPPPSPLPQLLPVAHFNPGRMFNKGLSNNNRSLSPC